jgi:hypothetical protein
MGMGSPAADLRLGGTGDGACCWLCVVVFFLLVSSVTISLCNFQTLCGLFDGLMLDLPLFFVLGCTLLLREA